MHLFISKKLLFVAILVGILLVVGAVLGLYDWRSAKTTIEVQASNVVSKVEQAAKISPPGTVKPTGNAVKDAENCRENLRRIQSAKRAVMARGGLTVNDVSIDAVKKELGGTVPRCPNGGEYVLGNMQTNVRCTIAGNRTTDPADDHMISKF